MPSRGIRNHNPGNIRHSNDRWLGEVDGTDKAFKTFSSPTYGIRALAKLLLNYERKYGLNTISGIISRWAPPEENDTAAYINAAAKACGVDPFRAIDVAAYLSSLVPAIIAYENGSQPYTDEQVSQAIALVTGGDNARVNSGVAEAPDQSPAHVLPPQGLQDAPGDGTTMGDAVRTVGVPAAGPVILILVALSKSKTAWGIFGMFGMQLLGLATWDVAIRVGQQIYTVPDLLPIFSSLFGGLGIWGRITAKPIGAKANA